MSSKNVTSSLNNLSLNNNDKRRQKKTPAAFESWEDEADSSSSDDTENARGGTITPRRRADDIPQAPPPTPSSPSHHPQRPIAYQSFSPSQFDAAFEPPERSTAGLDRRPETTTSVASRLIAAGIGQKAPRRTQEQREYDQAMKVQEKKKRDELKAAEQRRVEERERAKKAVWDD